MRKNSIRERAKRNSADVKSMVRRSMSTASLIADILANRGISQKEFAKKLGKKESEISKWLRGTHNFTFKTIGKIEDVLGVSLMYTADEAQQKIYIPVVILEGEQSFLHYPVEKYKYTDVKKGKTFEIQVTSISSSQTNTIKLDECQAN
jgi:transcriptional regulator with XRE-family HTH domain